MLALDGHVVPNHKYIRPPSYVGNIIIISVGLYEVTLGLISINGVKSSYVCMQVPWINNVQLDKQVTTHKAHILQGDVVGNLHIINQYCFTEKCTWKIGQN
jgi:hypothetical protein